MLFSCSMNARFFSVNEFRFLYGHKFDRSKNFILPVENVPLVILDNEKMQEVESSRYRFC